jgi:hypothetical protein
MYSLASIQQTCLCIALSVVLLRGKHFVARLSNFTSGCKENEIHTDAEILIEGKELIITFPTALSCSRLATADPRAAYLARVL